MARLRGGVNLVVLCLGPFREFSRGNPEGEIGEKDKLIEKIITPRG